MNKKLSDKILRVSATVLLSFIGLSAVGGGIMLINDPSGSSMQFPLDLLASTPFKNYLIPGITLLTFIGLANLAVAFMTIKRVKPYPRLILIQSVILILWLTVELIFNMDFFLPIYHIPLYAFSILLILIGYKLRINETYKN